MAVADPSGRRLDAVQFICDVDGEAVPGVGLTLLIVFAGRPVSNTVPIPCASNARAGGYGSVGCDGFAGTPADGVLARLPLTG